MTTRQLDTGTDDLLGRIEDHVAVLTFNRPERRNALSDAMYDGFEQVLPVIAADPDIWVVLLTGRGGAFCAGGDVQQMQQRNAGDGSGSESDGQQHDRAANGRGRPERQGRRAEAVVDYLRHRQRAVSLALHQFPRPVVAAIPGAVAGAGLSIALAADLRLAAERAVVVTAFSSVGASGDFGGSWFLTRLVGQSKAKELYFWSPRLSAAEALGLGLVNEVIPDEGFDEAALNYCHRLAARPPVALRYIKENINRALDVDLARALDAEAVAMTTTMTTDDHVEAATAFMEKRQPVFRGH